MPLAFIIGESGSGKTCLANLALPGLYIPLRGKSQNVTISLKTFQGLT